jgi:6-phosphogluconolactonase (cycloisomerase 2 family)
MGMRHFGSRSNLDAPADIAVGPRRRAISTRGRVGLVLAVLATAFATSQAAPTAVAAPRDLIVVANLNGNNVSVFTTTGTTRQLTPLTPPVTNTGNPRAVAFAPSGQFLYVAQQNTTKVSQYAVSSVTGALTPLNPATVDTGGTIPRTIAISPDGTSAYVTNAGSKNVAQFSIAADGTLKALPTLLVATGRGPTGVGVSNDGLSVYVTNFTDNTVSQYRRSLVNGALTPKSPATVPVGVNPAWITQVGNSMITANQSGSLSQMTLGSGGLLGTARTYPAGSGARAIAVVGGNLYSANQFAKTVSQFKIQADGSLAPMTPRDIPSGTAQGIVAANGGEGPVYVSGTGEDKIYQYSVTATGALQALPTVAAGDGPFGMAVRPARPVVEQVLLNDQQGAVTIPAGRPVRATVRLSAPGGNAPIGGTVTWFVNGIELGATPVVNNQADLLHVVVGCANTQMEIRARYDGDATYYGTSQTADVNVTYNGPAYDISMESVMVIPDGGFVLVPGWKFTLVGYAGTGPVVWSTNVQPNLRVSSRNLPYFTLAEDGTAGGVRSGDTVDITSVEHADCARPDTGRTTFVIP